MRISDLKPLVQAVLHPAFRFGLLPCVLLLCSATTVRAVPILVGTYASGNDSTTDFTAHNALIEDYNLDYAASLPTINSFVDKIEGSDEFSENTLQKNDFNWFKQSQTGDTVARNENIFDGTVGFSVVDPPTFGTDQVMGFEWDPSDSSSAPFEYYVSKSGNSGWSLWAYMENDFNPVYLDDGDGTGDSSIIGSDFSLDNVGFTRGLVNDTSLEFDPISPVSISHITFLSTANPAVVPEPASLAIWGMGMAAAGVGYRRRRRTN